MKNTTFKPKIPFNIELLILTTDLIKYLGEVKSKDTYEQNSTVFKEDGLFSSTIFGPKGSRERMEKFGYIDLHIPVFHPLIYRHLISLESLYKGILDGSKYAIWDDKIKNFLPADKTTGETGYNFFIKHFDEIKFRETDSDLRKNKINFIKKYKAKDVLISKYLVIPAGMRDRTELPNGKILEDEINNLYRKLLTVANTAKRFRIDAKDNPIINTVKNRLQKAVLDIYEYIENILSGKEGFIQGKWTKRTITYGTRNVITALPIKIRHNKQPNRPKMDHTVIGIFQFAKAITPVTIYQIRTKFLNRVFDQNSNMSYLYNKKTLEKEMVEISEKTRSNWITDEGLENTINKLSQDEIKRSPIIVDDHYMFLLYDDGKNIELIDDVNSLPYTYNKKYIRPMTYIELLYLALYDVADRYPGFVTRYPITGLGSVYPTKFYIKVNLNPRVVNLRLHGQAEGVTLYEYPNLNEPFFSSMSPHITHLDRLDADFDGDKMSANVVMEEESIEELENILNSAKYYLDENGKLIYSASNDISNLTLKIFTE